MSGEYFKFQDGEVKLQVWSPPGGVEIELESSGVEALSVLLPRDKIDAFIAAIRKAGVL